MRKKSGRISQDEIEGEYWGLRKRQSRKLRKDEFVDQNNRICRKPRKFYDNRIDNY